MGPRVLPFRLTAQPRCLVVGRAEFMAFLDDLQVLVLNRPHAARMLFALTKRLARAMPREQQATP